MFCTNCSTELPDEASFCWKCGQAVKTSERSFLSVSHESCTITLIEGFTRAMWEARVDRKVIAQSRSVWTLTIFTDVRDYVNEANHELAAQLMSEGWEPLTFDALGRVVAMQREKRS